MILITTWILIALLKDYFFSKTKRKMKSIEVIRSTNWLLGDWALVQPFCVETFHKRKQIWALDFPGSIGLISIQWWCQIFQCGTYSNDYFANHLAFLAECLLCTAHSLQWGMTLLCMPIMKGRLFIIAIAMPICQVIYRLTLQFFSCAPQQSCNMLGTTGLNCVVEKY